MARARLSLRSMNPPEMVVEMRRLADALSGNASFPDAGPFVESLRDQALLLEQGHQQRENLRQQAADLSRQIDEQAQAVHNLIADLRSHVDLVSGGAPEKIVSAGFSVRDQPIPVRATRWAGWRGCGRISAIGPVRST